MNTPDILLVEDDPHDAEWVRRILARLNLASRLVHAPDGQSALQLLLAPGETGSRLQPAFILLDLALPGIDGLHVLQQLKADEITREIPVFVLTGSGEDKLLLESYRCGASAYIVKPLSLETLTSALHDSGFTWSLTRRQAVRSASGAAASRRTRMRATPGEPPRISQS